MELLTKILKELEPFLPKVVLTPIQEVEIEQIEQQLGHQLPEYYKDFLRKIGLKQDFVWGLFGKIHEFVNLSNFLPENGSAIYFQFGDNGGDDYWLLKYDEQDCTIYEYDYYRNFEIISLGKTFDDLLIESLEKVKQNYEQMIPNAKKYWPVQFSIDTDNIEKVIGQLSTDDLEFKLIQNVKLQKITLRKLKVYKEGILSINNKEVELRKHETSGYGGYSTFYFDLQESIEQMKTDSFIKKVDKALRDSGAKYGMGDYGILWK